MPAKLIFRLSGRGQAHLEGFQALLQWIRHEANPDLANKGSCVHPQHNAASGLWLPPLNVTLLSSFTSSSCPPPHGVRQCTPTGPHRSASAPSGRGASAHPEWMVVHDSAGKENSTQASPSVCLFNHRKGDQIQASKPFKDRSGLTQKNGWRSINIDK